MSEPLTWANEFTEKELVDAVRKVSTPGSTAAAGERFALNIAARTPEKVAEVIKGLADEEANGLVDYLVAAESALRGRLDLVRLAMNRSASNQCE